MTLCVRCTAPIFEGDTGWYNQQPVTDEATGLTFVDRVIECGGASHVPATPEEREHLRHMTDGRWHDSCHYCLQRRIHGGTGLEANR